MAEARKILVVEDERIVAMDIQDSLERLGYEIVGNEAYGERAVELARELKPDLVLMDIMLKGEMDGIAASAMIWDTLRIPVVFLTAYGDEGTLQRAKFSEPFGYILKPFGAIELRAAIELALHRARNHAPRDNGRIERRVVDGFIADEGASAEATTRFLSRLPVLSSLGENEIETMSAVAHFRRVANGDVLFYEGDRLEVGRIVASGRISLAKTSANGKQLIVELLPPGDVLPLIQALQGDPAPWTARAQVPSTLFELPLPTVRVMLDRNPAIYKALIQYLNERLQRSHDRSRSFAHDSVEVRIAATLTALVPPFGRGSQSGKDVPSLIITRQELADLTGTTPETAIRITKHMEREGLLDLTRPGIIKILELEGIERLMA